MSSSVKVNTTFLLFLPLVGFARRHQVTRDPTFYPKNSLLHYFFQVETVLFLQEAFWWQVRLHLSGPQTCLEDLLNTDGWAPRSVFLAQWVWGGPEELHFQHGPGWCWCCWSETRLREARPHLVTALSVLQFFRVTITWANYRRVPSTAPGACMLSVSAGSDSEHWSNVFYSTQLGLPSCLPPSG